MVERVGGCGKSDGHRHGAALATTTLLIYKFNGPTAQRPNGPTAQRPNGALSPQKDGPTRKPSKKAIWYCAFMMERMQRNLYGVKTVVNKSWRRVSYVSRNMLGETLRES